jgi:hypothetical protein
MSKKTISRSKTPAKDAVGESAAELTSGVRHAVMLTGYDQDETERAS